MARGGLGAEERSPDGRLIAFSLHTVDGVSPQIYTMRPDARDHLAYQRLSLERRAQSELDQPP